MFESPDGVHQRDGWMALQSLKNAGFMLKYGTFDPQRDTRLQTATTSPAIRSWARQTCDCGYSSVVQ
ncbi:hypothetical protein M405DRAFT_830684 [Rhizopogon salebrosus TDB-379]|nr:hypothetical protein M405DRAFT_830684 [Rhizopogon salebrosus TDB-379]